MDAEVFVVDNNSIDGSVEMVEKKFPWVKLIANKDNPGFSKANNQAIRISAGKHVLLLNPDTVVEEDTFRKVVDFMENHPEAGGLGVKMIDGKGKFLPESKRGLPTPEVAFYKIFGLASFFPKSKKFGRYHLGYLSKNETHEIDILSGAFMLMRKEALDKVGLLDEDFFMYGEDIDLSYRIQQGGYKNYYYHDTTIIHYKGESTKKSSINYVFVFYNAMVIFAKKHFSAKNANTFSTLINIAIYLRASIAVLNRFVKHIALPALDFGLSLSFMFIASHFYTSSTGIIFPTEILNIALPLYAATLTITTYFSGGYDKPINLFSTLKGIIIGTGIILISYALLPKSVQFSRLFIFIAASGTLGLMVLLRLILHITNLRGFKIGGDKNDRFLLVGEEEEADRILHLLKQMTTVNYAVTLSPKGESGRNINQFSDFIHINKVNEVIFCAKDISAQKIMELMSTSTNNKIDYKIAQPDSLYLIGSNSIHTSGELHFLNINSISLQKNQRNKRVFDLAISSTLILLSPLLILRYRNTGGFIKNCLRTLFGKASWVGYNQTPRTSQLPTIKKGIIPVGGHSDRTEETSDKLNVIYAKNYHVRTDLKTFFSNLSDLDKC